MKHRLFLTPLEKKSIQYLLVSALLIFCGIALNCITKTIDFRFMFEIATTLVAILVSIFCFIHMHEEHTKMHHQEICLKQKIIDKIYYYYAYLPYKRAIIHRLNTKLEKMSSPLQRLHLLKRFHQNTLLLENFICAVIQAHYERQTLKDLGLRW